MTKRNTQGYAIVVVLVLLVIGTATIVLMSRESNFFTKVSGFFSRARKIQGYAESGTALAKGDLMKIAYNSSDGSLTGVDKFFSTSSGGQQGALDLGIYFDTAGSMNRSLTPRISRTDGDFQLRVFYFPENPCVDVPCSTELDYNLRMPKRFLIVSEVLNTTNGEVFTVESRVQMQYENFAEIAFGITGTGAYPCTSGGPPCVGKYDFSPGVYGRSHFNIPANKLQFSFVYPGGPDVSDPSQMFFFTDLATFSGTSGSGPYPFTLYEHSIQQQQLDGSYAVIPGAKKNAMMNFAKGFEEDVEVTTAGNEPTSDANFSLLASQASSDGYNIGNNESCPGGGKSIDVCLKMVGNKIVRYNCNYIDAADRIMGRVDNNVHPAAAVQPGRPEYANISTGVFAPGMETSFPDRYTGERGDVSSNATTNTIPIDSVAGIQDIPTSGVVYCHNSTCGCNIHVKGIADGQVTFAATDVTIEGDIAYQNPDPNYSTNMVGIIAKNNVIIPPGVPQAATTATSNGHPYQWEVATQDFEPPFTDTTPGGQAGNLAEAYLGITNFIPFNSGTGQYLGRNTTNPDYTEFAKWDLSLTNDKMYNSPTTLDLDAHIFAGNTFKIDGIFNPEVSADGKKGIATLTCEDPPACTDYKYRNMGDASGTGNALYNPDGTLAAATTSGTVKPLIWADGMNQSNLWIDQGNGRPRHAQFLDKNFNGGEELPRALNRGINVFGSMNSKFHYIFDEFKNANGQAFRMGFKRKLIQGDPRAKFMSPPSYPATKLLRIDELHNKFHQGKSSLIPN